MVMLIDSENTFDKTPQSLMIKIKKSLPKLRTVGKTLAMIKSICKKPTADIRLNFDKLGTFMLRLRT